MTWDERLTDAVRSLRPEAPADLLPEILRQYRESPAEPRPLAPVRRPAWRTLIPVAAAAALVVSVTLWLAGPWRAADSHHPHLLSEQAHQEVRQDEATLSREGADLMARLSTPAGNDRTGALLEEAHHLDIAVEECQRALQANPRSRHLNDRLLELSRRRNHLLEAASRESRG